MLSALYKYYKNFKNRPDECSNIITEAKIRGKVYYLYRKYKLSLGELSACDDM